MTPKEKIFVTGGSGFVGRNVIRRLVSDGYEVYALFRSDNAQKTVAAVGANPVFGALDDIDKMQNAMKGCSTVYHVAANTNSAASEYALFRDNVIGTENVIQAAKLAKVPLLIYVSTDAVLIENKSLINADERLKTPANFCGNYAKTKSIAEKQVIMANDYDLKTIILRPRLIWGCDDNKFLPSLIRKVEKKVFFWINSGRYLTSTCHIYNLCEGLILAKKYGQGGAIYFLTDGKPIEFRSFVTALLSTKGIIPPNRSIPFPIIKNLLIVAKAVSKTMSKTNQISIESLYLLGMEITLNDSKARDEINYYPIITIQEGIKDLLRIHEKNDSL